jgi:hypothetical protein
MITVVEKLLSERFEGKVCLAAAQEIRSGGRSTVSRFPVLEGPQCAPQSVIVKQAVTVGREVYNPDTPDGPAWRLFSEWAGLRFLTETSGGASPTPRFYGGDRDHGLLALEDLGAGKGLDHALLGADPVYAEAMLVAFAATLGRIHALTWGISTMRQRALLRFDIFWKTAEEYGHLKSVGATVRMLAEKLRARWPAEADAMPYYPAFRRPGLNSNRRQRGEKVREVT